VSDVHYKVQTCPLIKEGALHEETIFRYLEMKACTPACHVVTYVSIERAVLRIAEDIHQISLAILDLPHDSDGRRKTFYYLFYNDPLVERRQVGLRTNACDISF
jgi:hypothetical protein